MSVLNGWVFSEVEAKSYKVEDPVISTKQISLRKKNMQFNMAQLAITAVTTTILLHYIKHSE